MKWFIFSFLPLLAILGNVLLLGEPTVLKVLGAFSFNAFVFSLTSMWWHAYFRANQIRAKGLILAHALLFFSVALCVILLGTEMSLSSSCDAIMTEARTYRIRNHIASHIQTLGLCREFGFLVVLIGIFVAYPSLRLFKSLARR